MSATAAPNIGGTVDVKALAGYAASLPRVAVSRDYKYMCSDPGQALIEQDIADHKLNRVVRGLLFAAVARGHLPPRSWARRPESVLFADGQHSRACLVGPSRQKGGDGKGPGSRARRRAACCLAQTIAEETS